MPITEGGRYRRTRYRPGVLLAVVLLVVLQLATGAGAAQALPAGAYWYKLLDLPKAWTITEGAGVTVAVIDSGVDARVGDLAGQVLPGLDLTGQDPGGQRDDPIGHDRFGHGTDMATLIAGTGRGAGLVGVAPKARILPIDASSHDSYTMADVATGITWAVDHGAKVINMSLGGSGPCDPAVATALRHAYEKNVIVVAASGEPAGPVDTPANCPGALAIGAVDAAIKPWTKTAVGPEVDFGAPGYALVNELLTNRLNPSQAANSGTSQASAIAAGTFALLRARFPTETARQIVTRALYNVHNGVGTSAFGRRVNNSFGYGMVLPRYALTVAPPANATNPIFDQWAKDFGSASSGSGAPSSTPSDTPASGAPASGTPSSVSAPSSSSSSSSAAAASGGGGGGVSPVLLALIGVVVLGVVVAVVVVLRRGRSPGGPPGYPPPPPGYRR